MAVEFHDNSVKVKAALNDAIIQFLHDAGMIVESDAVSNTKGVDTGQLKNSWNYIVDESKSEVVIGSPLENAIWTELGTGEYALEGNGRKDPWFIPVEGYTGKRKPTYEGKVVVVYGKDGTAFYKTNGKKPKRMLHNAFVKNKAKIIRRAESILKGKMQ